MKKYEYKFVTMKAKAFSGPDYRHIVQQHAQDGWRLNQIFTMPPGWFFATAGNANIELVFEREIEKT